MKHRHLNSKRGYIELSVGSKRFTAHRMAWMYVYGSLPDLDLDHNTIKTDNRIANLRRASHSQNLMNTPKRKSCSSKYKGVCWDSSREKWVAWIQFSNNPKFLGRFEKEEDAYVAYCEAAKKYHGEFARLA